MIYLDYAANTPVCEEVLQRFINTARDYIANPNSAHELGKKAQERFHEASSHVAKIMEVKPSEVIFTSGASEANNLAIKGIARAYRQNGKHIISTGLEHSAVSGALTYLQSLGYEIDLLDIMPDGTIDMNHLKELLRQDTILVTIGYVDSELGVVQPIEEIGKLLKEYPNCHFHTDATQAVGKIKVNTEYVDLMSFAPHKFFGLNGAGVLIKKEGVILEPLIHGGMSTSLYRSGTPDLAMAVALEEALSHATDRQNERYDYVSQLNKKLLTGLKALPQVRINSTEKSYPFIVNLSVKGIKAEPMRQALEEKGILVSTKSACSVPNTPSRAVYAVTRDRKNALSSFRISLSHLVTEAEIEAAIKAIKEIIEDKE